MKYISLFLACLILLGAFVGCNDKPAATTKKPLASTPQSDATGDPEEEYLELYYDDRVYVREIAGKVVAHIDIKDQVITSTSIATGESDENILKYDYDKGRIIAVGTGTATLVLDDVEYKVRVSPAPITLTIITGHSSGAGSKGNGEESVLCEAGTAYNKSLDMKSSAWKTSLRGSSLGYYAEDRVPEIDCITDDAGKTKGARGVNSALAYEWHNLTGEKMWVMNCAVGGSCINQWQPGHPDKYLDYTIEAMNRAHNILKNEVSAGHYEYKGTYFINFGNSNWDYQNVTGSDELYVEWNDGMWQGTIDGATVDIDGDGEIDTPAALAYLPSWSHKTTNFNHDAPLMHYRAMSEDYPDIFYATTMRRLWSTEEAIVEYFPDINYTTQSGVKLQKPTNMKEFLAEDNKHLAQVSYNALGLDLALSLYQFVTKDYELKSVTLYDVTGGCKEVGSSMTIKVGEKNQFVAISDPCPINDFEITVTGVLTIDELFYVTGTKKGEGELIIKHNGEVVKSVKITVK